jgi:hypothetical protein
MKEKAFYLTLLVLLGVVLVSGSGCSMQAPGLTKNEVERRHLDNWRNSMWQMQDDWDAVWMIDRPSRQSPMYVR